MTETPALATRRGMTVCMLLHKSVVHDSRVRREARTLARAGHAVTVLELASVPEGERSLDGFARRSVQPPAWVRRLLPFATYRLVFAVTFVRGAIRQRPEVVHAHDAAMLAPGALIARWTGALLVYDSHELATGVEYRSGAWESFVRALERLLVRRCAAVITVSDGIADRLQELYGTRERPTVLRNVSDLQLPQGALDPGLRARLDLGSAPLVLHQGSAAPGRGCEVLVHAVAGLAGAHLVLLGGADEPNGESLVALADELGAADRVHVLESVPLDELLGCTAEADVGVSLLQDSCENHRLALPNKVFEYIAAGVPVVTSDLPELRRVVDGYAIGWTVAPDDVADVRRGLEAALGARGDAGLRERVAAAGRELRWDVERERLLALYRGLQGGEHERLAGVYAAYRASPRSQRRWDAENAGNVMLRERLLARLLELTGAQRDAAAQILDIGCGRGWWLGRLAQSGVDATRLYGVDLLADRVDAAARHVPGAAVVRADGADLPFGDGRFGVVLMLTTLSSAGGAARRARMLAEARRVLAPDGLLLVYEPRLPNPRNPDTHRVSRREVDRIDRASIVHEPITLFPPLARLIGERGRFLYRIRALRSHRLSIVRASS